MTFNSDFYKGGGAEHGGIGVESTQQAREAAEEKATLEKQKDEKAVENQRAAEAAAKEAAKNSEGH